jgi:ABC-type antimicrobial peptide transport system permease subunit
LLAPWTTIKSRVAGTSAQTTSSDQGVRYPGQTLPLYPQLSQAQAADFPAPLLPTNIDQILVRVDTEPQLPGAIRDITTLLHDRHRIPPGQPDDFSIRDMTEIKQALRSTSQSMTWSLLIAASVALAVVGVGIFLIRLVSVTARRPAIGLRLASGARPREILWRFLMGAILLGLLSGILGVLLGRLGSYLVWQFWHWPVEPSLPVAGAILAASVGVGLIFGCYPAWKASRLARIEALPQRNP